MLSRRIGVAGALAASAVVALPAAAAANAPLPGAIYYGKATNGKGTRWSVDLHVSNSSARRATVTVVVPQTCRLEDGTKFPGGAKRTVRVKIDSKGRFRGSMRKVKHISYGNGTRVEETSVTGTFSGARVSARARASDRQSNAQHDDRCSGSVRMHGARWWPPQKAGAYTGKTAEGLPVVAHLKYPAGAQDGYAIAAADRFSVTVTDCSGQTRTVDFPTGTGILLNVEGKGFHETRDAGDIRIEISARFLEAKLTGHAVVSFAGACTRTADFTGAWSGG